jgi:hypothetical protein
MRDDGISCEALERALHEGRKLTTLELAHVEGCDECMDVWLTLALEAKPEVAIPENFAARVAAGLPVRQPTRTVLRGNRHWGLVTAMAVVTVLMAVGYAGSPPATSWVGLVFMSVVATEIAGLALWLGPRWSGR